MGWEMYDLGVRPEAKFPSPSLRLGVCANNESVAFAKSCTACEIAQAPNEGGRGWVKSGGSSLVHVFGKRNFVASACRRVQYFGGCLVQRAYHISGDIYEPTKKERNNAKIMNSN